MLYIVALVAFAIRSLIVMLLWNYLVPAISTLGDVTYLQAMALCFLAELLVSGIQVSGQSDK